MIGEFKHRIELLNPVVTKSVTAGTTKEYTAFGVVWAKVERKGSRYTTEGNKPEILSDYYFTVRGSVNIDTNLSKDTVITHDGSNYQVVDFKKINEDNFYYFIQATETITL